MYHVVYESAELTADAQSVCVPRWTPSPASTYAAAAAPDRPLIRRLRPLGQTDRDGSVSVVYERLAGMVGMLGVDVQAMVVHNAYAIDMPAPDTLTHAVSALQASMGVPGKQCVHRAPPAMPALYRTQLARRPRCAR